MIGHGWEMKYIFLGSIQPIQREIEKYLSLYTYPDFPPMYNISTLYFDSRDFDLFKRKVLNPKQNFLFRYRWYGSLQNHLFFEVKKRVKGRRLKTRVILTLEQARQVAEGNYEELNSFLLPNEITDLLNSIRPSPKILILYRRMAFQDARETIRITLDSDISFKKVNGLHEADKNPDSFLTFGFNILELKVAVIDESHSRANILPEWFQEGVLGRFDFLDIENFSKYVFATSKLNHALPQPSWLNRIEMMIRR